MGGAELVPTAVTPKFWFLSTDGTGLSHVNDPTYLRVEPFHIRLYSFDNSHFNSCNI